MGQLGVFCSLYHEVLKSFSSHNYCLVIACGFTTFSFTGRGKHFKSEAQDSHSVFLFPRFAVNELLH